jgi:hypothetical protein
VSFLDYAWVGNVSEISASATPGTGPASKPFRNSWRGPRSISAIPVSASAYIDNRILSELFGVKVNMVKGYPGSADEAHRDRAPGLDDCGSWTSMPRWRDSKITIHIRFSRTLVPACGVGCGRA